MKKKYSTLEMGIRTKVEKEAEVFIRKTRIIYGVADITIQVGYKFGGKDIFNEINKEKNNNKEENKKD